MIYRNIVVFNGFDPSIVHEMKSSLKGRQVSLVVISREKVECDGYYEKLSSQILYEINKISAQYDGNVRIRSILVSAVEGDLREEEYNNLFPSFVRLGISRVHSQNKDAKNIILDKIFKLIDNVDYKEFIISLYEMRRIRFLLPVLNSREVRVKRFLESIYYGGDGRGDGDFSANCDDLEKKLSKKVNVVRSTKDLKIGRLTFSPTINDGKHPIRRCTNTSVCDLRAILRFGVKIPDRFEFDVTSAGSLSDLTFYLCDKRGNSPRKNVDHLNMRINDDFE